MRVPACARMGAPLLAMLLAMSACGCACSASMQDDATRGEGLQMEEEAFEREGAPTASGETEGGDAMGRFPARQSLEANGVPFELVLDDSPTARSLVRMLPLEGTFSELNGNEKYLRLPQALPTDAVAVPAIEAGDVMLYQEDCLVIFYESHANPGYAYTRLGRIEEPDGLAQAVGAGSARVVIGA